MRYTRSVLLVFLLVGATVHVYAQRNPSLISSRHYLGLEVGVNDTWLAGGSNFFWPYTYPYSDDPSNPVIAPLAFNSLGSGIGFHIGATIDYALSDAFSLQGKFFYRQHKTSNTEQLTGPCTDVSGGTAGTATFESNYTMKLSYLGGDLGLRIQIVPESFYGVVGLEYTSLSSNKFSGGESIVSSTNGCQFLTQPNGSLTGQTSLSIPEQSTNNFFNSSQVHVRLALGTFIKLGSSDIVLTPELALGIPLSTLLTSEQTDAYTAGYPTNNPSNPSYPTATPPKLWYAAVSLGIKFPFGATSQEVPLAAETARSTNEETKPDEKYADLTGRVTDANTGEPLKANVTVVDLGNNQIVKQAKTDKDGTYDVKVKAPGRYSVTADADNHLFGSTAFSVDDQGRILKGDHDIKLANADNGRTRLLIFFEFGQSNLEVDSYPELERAVTIMRANPSMQVEIAGYSDNVGTDDFNKELSLRRAQAVRDYLVKHGIDPSRITAKGYGKENPIAPNDSDENRAKNRRVEFVVLKK